MEELKVIHLFKYVQLKRESNIAPIHINKNCVRKEREELTKAPMIPIKGGWMVMMRNFIFVDGL